MLRKQRTLPCDPFDSLPLSKVVRSFVRSRRKGQTKKSEWGFFFRATVRFPLQCIEFRYDMPLFFFRSRTRRNAVALARASYRRDRTRGARSDRDGARRADFLRSEHGLVSQSPFSVIAPQCRTPSRSFWSASRPRRAYVRKSAQFSTIVSSRCIQFWVPRTPHGVSGIPGFVALRSCPGLLVANAHAFLTRPPIQLDRGHNFVRGRRTTMKRERKTLKIKYPSISIPFLVEKAIAIEKGPKAGSPSLKSSYDGRIVAKLAPATT